MNDFLGLSIERCKNVHKKFMGTFSKFCDVLSGASQGSVLRPLLFVTFINDLPDSILYGTYRNCLQKLSWIPVTTRIL